MTASPAPVHGPHPDPPASSPAGSGVQRGRVGFVPPREWDLWLQSRRVIVYVLLVDVAAVILAIGSLTVVPLRREDLLLGLPLLVATMTYLEATGPIERARERNASIPHVDLNSTWMVSAALLLHPASVAVVVAVIYTQRWVRIRHHIVFRQTVSGAAAVLSAYAAMAALAVGGRWLDLPRFADMPRDAASSGVVLAAGVAYVVTNVILIAIPIAMTHPNPKLSTITPGWDGFTLELATVALAILVAWALVDWPAALLLIFGLSYVLHGNILFPQLRRAARLDAKTGLLNLPAWRAAANKQLADAQRAGRPAALLMFDLDHFKHVNDTWGHLVGDAVLINVALALPRDLRELDLVGRFGGEEFVVLLPDAAQPSANVVAERIRHRISQLEVVTTDAVVTVTASVGVALYPDHGQTLNELIAAADRAAYAAKDQGRNQVRYAHPT